MQKYLTAPRITNYIHWLGRLSYRGSDFDFTYDPQSYKDIEEIFRLIRQIKPNGKNGSRELWLRAERGPIEDFGDYEEYLDDGQVENREEFEKLWLDYYPEAESWFEFVAVEDAEINYQAILVGQRFCIEVDGRKNRSAIEHDISPFTGWLLDSVRCCINGLKDDSYNTSVQNGLPPKHRTGTIVRKHLWDAFPEAREAFFSPISTEDVEMFVALAREQGKTDSQAVGLIRSMTANDFYRFFALGYSANKNKGCDLPTKEQYYLHADGRDEGLKDLDGDSPEAFREWMQHRPRGGHPWEVCRGGNSTHIDLFVVQHDGGYSLAVAGSALTRTVEAVKFFLALYRAGLPVTIREAETLAERLTEREKIGIVPTGVIPVYCESLFPGEHIIDFMNLPEEKQDELLPFCKWQPIEEVTIVE